MTASAETGTLTLILYLVANKEWKRRSVGGLPPNSVRIATNDMLQDTETESEESMSQEEIEH